MVWVIAFGELFFGDLWCVVWGYGGMRTHFSLLNPFFCCAVVVTLAFCDCRDICWGRQSSHAKVGLEAERLTSLFFYKITVADTPTMEYHRL